MTLPSPQDLADVRLIVDALDGKAPEDYEANPIIARQVVGVNAEKYARWVVALAERVQHLEEVQYPMPMVQEEEKVIYKGDWIWARWMDINTGGNVSGSQMKFAARERIVSGVVKHVRGDHPTNPTSIRLFVEPDGGGPEVIVDPKYVRDVRPKNNPLNQCEHTNMQSTDGVHWSCPDCPLSFDDWGEGGVHGGEEQEEQERLEELKSWPAGRLRPSEEHPGVTLFTVRLYDMMDGWIDVLPKVSEDEAMAYWLKHTNYGKEKTMFADGDYYRIFPADTNMVVTPEFLGR